MCHHCGAKRFYHELVGFCCSDGQISLVTNDYPEELYTLLTLNSKDVVEFRQYVSTYNNTFAFTSLGVKYEPNLCKRNRGLYTFKFTSNETEAISSVVDTKPIVVVTHVRVLDFNGLSLSTRGSTTITINPDIPEAISLQTWSLEHTDILNELWLLLCSETSVVSKIYSILQCKYDYVDLLKENRENIEVNANSTDSTILLNCNDGHQPKSN
ncbi:hypothetical protein HHK36_028515 [Tetracentron sinense]|uniref:Uncharacterized protein n=1 Tax=Tetracentron sinense TaxID=13715 RepID=A0A834YBI0_TETSI|nr:hypothetical protein HHK36_028515 [Tetracentron sinense]